MTSFDPPTSAYVTSGFSSTVIIVTVGSIFAGRGMWMKYLVRSTPTRMPSSMSVGATVVWVKKKSLEYLGGGEDVSN
jgi:hypothetical protein